MIPSWAHLDEQDRARFRAALAFLKGRLAERGTVEWAASLRLESRIERIAVEELINGPNAVHLGEPWVTAWRLIQESWAERPTEVGPSTAIYGIQRRLLAGDRSGTIISAITDLVAPRLQIEPINSSWQLAKIPKRPKTFHHLLSAQLSSGDLANLSVLSLSKVDDVPFLVELASVLDSAVNRGLNIGRRIGWDGRRLWQLGDLYRVYYVVPEGHGPPGGRDDPDAFNKGIAPAVKLLHAVVSRISELSSDDVLAFVRRWSLQSSPIHIRLWAAFARNSALVTSGEVSSFLLDADDTRFWDVYAFPEIAELRARRFGDLDAETQELLIKRLRKGPPRDLWPKRADAEKVKSGRVYWSLRELQRIKLAGGELPEDADAWLNGQLAQYPDLIDMSPEVGFQEGPTVRDVVPNPESKYDVLEGTERLRALEAALGSARRDWNDDPAERADDWLRQPGKAYLALSDLETARRGGDDFPKVWNRFGWAHTPAHSADANAPPRDLQSEANRVLELLAQLSDRTLSIAVEGISNWIDYWGRQVAASALGPNVWLKMWPFAVAATNASSEEGGSDTELSLSVTAAANDEREPMDLDTLNSPAGKLVGAFLATCPSLAQTEHPFVVGSTLYQMRDALNQATGRSGLIAKHRLIEHLPYFLRADRIWAEEFLFRPLLNDDGGSLALWRAIARRTQYTPVLEVIGGTMASRATDRRLGRETRSRLVFSLVVEALDAFFDGRAPAVPNARLTQTLRIVEDEVRARAANTLQQFVREVSSRPHRDLPQPPSPEVLFRSAVAPFIRGVWPQERSLTTQGVSKAFADLPATTGRAFADAVDLVERFLMPFDCWSLLDYGLHGDEDGEKKLAMIDDELKAKALLKLLDLTIGNSEGAIVPYDLTDALDQIRSVAPALAESATYRRLAALARR